MRKVWRFSDPVFCGLTPKHPVAMVLGNAQDRKSAKTKKASNSTDRRVTPKSTIMIQQAGQRCPVALRAAVASNEPKRPRSCRHSRKSSNAGEMPHRLGEFAREDCWLYRAQSQRRLRQIARPCS
jgi:hypothetical protein